MPYHQHHHRGFTLIELMSVLCIVGILALIAYPSYRGHVIKAGRTEARAALMRVMQQQERYFTRHNRYHAYGDATEAGPFTWHSGDTAATSAYQISAAACPGTSIQDCVLLSARPGGAAVNASYSDTQCGTLALNSRGEWTNDASQVCR